MEHGIGVVPTPSPPLEGTKLAPNRVQTTMPQPVRRPSRRSFWTLLLLFGGMLACMLLAGELVYHRALRGEAESVQRQLTLSPPPLAHPIDPYRPLPAALP